MNALARLQPINMGGAYAAGIRSSQPPQAPQNALAGMAQAPNPYGLSMGLPEAYSPPPAPGGWSMGEDAAQPNALAENAAPGGNEAAMRLAGQQIGLNENAQSAALSEYLANGGASLDPATTAWCAAFVNATLAQTGGTGTGKMNARSFLDWGSPVDTPQRGDIAVFSRGDPNGWQGHVGFFDSYTPDGRINVLGGNQSDSVSIAPYGADRLLGFRRI